MIENVITTEEERTIGDAIKILFERHVGALVITDDKGKCKGIFTERDALRSVAKEVPLDTNLRNVMSKNVVTLRITLRRSLLLLLAQGLSKIFPRAQMANAHNRLLFVFRCLP